MQAKDFILSAQLLHRYPGPMARPSQGDVQVTWSHVCKALCSLGREPSAVVLKSMKWGMTAALSFPEGFGNTDGVRDGRGFANGRAQFTRAGP